MLTDDEIMKAAVKRSHDMYRLATSRSAFQAGVIFARAVEAEVRKQDEALIRQMRDALEYHEAQTRPIFSTTHAITAANARLGEVHGIPT